MGEKSLGKFFVYCLLILLLFLVMIKLVFTFGGNLFRAELIVLLFLMILSLIGFSGYSNRWGERALFFVFVLGLGNLILIWYFTKDLYILPLFLVLVGFMIGMPKKEEKEIDSGSSIKIEPYGDVFEEKLREDPQVEIIEDDGKKSTFSPGKYVASNRGSVYHEPKCDWAKKIVEGRRVWFNDRKEAEKKKYKAHSCVN